MQHFLLDALQDLVGVKIDVANIRVDQFEFQAIEHLLLEPLPLYQYENSVGAVEGIMQLNSHTTAHLSRNALKSSRPVADFKGQATLLDVYLGQSLAKAVNILSLKRRVKLSVKEGGLGLKSTGPFQSRAEWHIVDLRYISQAAKRDNARKEDEEAPEFSIKLFFKPDILKRLAGSESDPTYYEDLVAWSSHMMSVVDRSFVDLDAVLCEYQSTIAACSRLNLGDVIPLHMADANQVMLTPRKKPSMDIADGRLGQMNGHRGICLNNVTLDAMPE